MKNVLKPLLFVMLLSFNQWVLAAESVNINTADAETLAAQLKGVGLSKAQAIVDYRNEHGPFKSVAGLAAVKGIGEKIIADNSENLATK